MTTTTLAERNELFPVFLKLKQIRVLIVGGGYVGMEKLQAILSNSPSAIITLVALNISDEIKEYSKGFSVITLLERPYHISDFDAADIAIAAINDPVISSEIARDAHRMGILINVADKPELCDFYLGSIIQKGSLKIAISTNGKSPTVAKRLKEVIGDMIPDEMEGVLNNVQIIRNSINGSFDEKVKKLNELTKVLVSKQAFLENENLPEQKKWPRIVMWCLLAFLLMIMGHGILSYVPFNKITENIGALTAQIDTKTFLIMLAIGFLAQMSDGSLGMGYGTICTTFLLAFGVPPAFVSSQVHSARVFSSGVSGYSHHRFGNINKKLFKAIVIPGIIGAIIGAGCAFFFQKYADRVKIPLAIYTLYLGYFIIKKAFNKRKAHDKVKKAGWLASVGGFVDAFAGGGWGTLVTSTLMAKRKSPRYVIGSVCLAEFFVVLTSSITFFILLKTIPIFQIAGLIIGGLIAAPIAARLVGKLPLKTMFILVGSLVIITSLNSLWKAIVHLM
ncbi:TSUP family transporter [Ferruginibacter sp.]|uniref:TSUP family transporter n=1 Tax=Ferruginibacter sp. TaxID=1940288 RepID=UPI0026597317|nr:TSUP family transporter [Ferruginibacter sp.]